MKRKNQQAKNFDFQITNFHSKNCYLLLEINKMLRLIIFSSLLFFLLSSCQKQKNAKVSETFEKTKPFNLPKDAIHITYDNHIYFQLAFDSIKGNFVFDTGADRLYYDSIFYYDNKFTYKNIGLGKLPGVGLKKQLVRVVFDSINFKLKNESFCTSITPIIKLKPILGDFADGIIGGELFNKSILEISYDKEFMKIHASLDSVDIVPYKKIKLERIQNRLYLPLSVKINDSLIVQGKFILDLGSGSSISFTNHTSKKYNFTKNIGFKIPYYTKYGGIGGESSSFNFESESIVIGDFKLNKVVMEYSIDNSGALSKRNYLGILGNEILEKFDIIIDNTNCNLYLKPNSMFNNPFNFSSKGFSYVDRQQTKGAWIVTGMVKGGNAEKAGLKIDDKIIKVNNINISSKEFNKKSTFFQDLDTLKLSIYSNDKTNKLIKFKLEN